MTAQVTRPTRARSLNAEPSTVQVLGTPLNLTSATASAAGATLQSLEKWLSFLAPDPTDASGSPERRTGLVDPRTLPAGTIPHDDPTSHTGDVTITELSAIAAKLDYPASWVASYLYLRKWKTTTTLPREFLTAGNPFALFEVFADFIARTTAARIKPGRIDITNGYRSAEYNLAVGGATNSAHLRGAAFDLHFRSQREFETAGAIAAEMWDDRIINGFGAYKSRHIHLEAKHPGGKGHRKWGSAEDMFS